MGLGVHMEMKMLVATTCLSTCNAYLPTALPPLLVACRCAPPRPATAAGWRS